MKQKEMESRILEEALYYIDNHSTFRSTAKKFGISKSTVHKDLSERLWDISYSLALKVDSIIKENINERALRGGMATKQKYLNLKEAGWPASFLYILFP